MRGCRGDCRADFRNTSPIRKYPWVLGVVMCAVLMTRVDFSKSVVLLITIALALANWAAVRHRSPGQT